MGKKDDVMKKQTKAYHRQAFDFILECYDIEDPNRPLCRDDFRDPYGKYVSLVMYLYSLEPAFYSEINHGCHTLDQKRIKKIGPLARCIFSIFQTKCETKKKDKLLTGDSKKVDPKDVKAYGIFAKSFFLYRGVSLTQEQIKLWEKKVIAESTSGEPEPIKIRGYLSASSSMSVALDQADHDSQTLSPVLFVINVRNYQGYDGFRLNTSKYSACPYEEECLLKN